MTEIFIQKAKTIIEEIFNQINKNYQDIDTDLIDNVLTIEFSEDKIFVISIHEPTKQIWYSSPLSGAHHFEMNDDQVSWTNTRKKEFKFPDIVYSEIQDTIK